VSALVRVLWSISSFSTTLRLAHPWDHLSRLFGVGKDFVMRWQIHQNTLPGFMVICFKGLITTCKLILFSDSSLKFARHYLYKSLVALVAKGSWISGTYTVVYGTISGPSWSAGGGVHIQAWGIPRPFPCDDSHTIGPIRQKKRRPPVVKVGNRRYTETITAPITRVSGIDGEGALRSGSP
jgi:hypothetical protein